MMIIKTVLFLAFLSNSVSATSAIIDSDINLICGPYLISVTTTFEDKVNNKFNRRNNENADMHYDYVVLKSNKLSPALNLEHSGWISDTKIGLSSFLMDENITVDRISGKLNISKQPHNWQQKPKPHTSYNCKSTSRKRLDNLIKNHNKPINDSYRERKF
jgi:uncharacterized protein YbcC (UPF0753/DUF2309 family)